MLLIFMRHGEAVPEEPGLANRDRQLTKKGKRQARATASILAKFLKERPVRIFTSPYLRCRQTAQILAEGCFAEGLHLADELLQGEFPLVESALLPEDGPVAFVSHHPFLQNYLYQTAGAAVKFEQAAVAVVDYDTETGRGKLIAYFTPKLKDIRKEKK